MRSRAVSILISILMITNTFGVIAQNVGGPSSSLSPTGNPLFSNISTPIPQNNGPPSPSSKGSGGLADSPWPMFRQNLNHTGQSPYGTSTNPGKLKWSFETGGSVSSSPAIDSDGTIYVGSWDNNLYAINPDGTMKWSFTTGDWVESSPAIGSDGTIYVGVEDKDSRLIAINPDGTEKWSFKINRGISSSPAIGPDGTIYTGTSGYNKLYAINPDGIERWIFKIIDPGLSSPAIGTDGTIYIGSQGPDNRLYSINPDGTEKWNFTTDNDVHSSPAIGSDGTIYVGSGDHKLYAINPNGTEKWTFLANRPVYSSPAIDSDGTIYVGSWDNNLYAINPDGTMKWSFTTGRFIYLSSPAIGSEGTIYIGSTDSKLYAINPDGTEKWSFATSGEIWSSPAIGSDGTIYMGSYDGKLYALGTLPDADAGPDLIVNEGDVVHFNGSASYDPDGTIIKYEWDFDESDGLWWETGARPDAFGPTTSHVYGDNGIYTVTLRVTEDKGGKDTDICNITVNNVAPIINSISAPPGNEGSPITFISSANDIGSDDITFIWNWGDGTNDTMTIYYNDGMGTDPYPSPSGIFPFAVTDIVQHKYEDNGEYIATITVEDDDGGATVITTNVTVYNEAPTLTLTITPSGDEGENLTFSANATDPGSDDLSFTWEFEYGLTITNTYYNDGMSPDPAQSPWGNYPFNASDAITHTYGDDYNYTLVLTVTDDDGGVTTYTTTVTIDNIAPYITLFAMPIWVGEGASATYVATAEDHGSDDLTFEWFWDDGTPVDSHTQYNNGVSPDPGPSPNGAFPFTASETVNHTYGDNYNYSLTLKVTDDDGGITTFTTTVVVHNIAPVIEPFGPFTVDEGSPLDITAHSTDPGSDDLTFTWKFELGPTITNIRNNNGLGPDPYPSPWGVYPYSVSDSVEHTYGDNGIFTVTLTVSDDDGGVSTYLTNITVNNVAPSIESIGAYMYVNFTLRIAGEKWHSVNMTLYEDNIEIWNAGVTRQPGSPDEQAATLSGYSINVGSTYRAVIDYLPNDPRVNGNVWGGNPVWIVLEFQDGTSEKLHHTFNVRKSYWQSDHWNHIDPWEVDLTGIIYSHNITLKASATDPGSDDFTFNWYFGDGGIAGPNIYFNNGISPDPFPSLEINPMNATDNVKHAYATSGSYTITLVVADDDGGITSATLIIEF